MKRVFSTISLVCLLITALWAQASVYKGKELSKTGILSGRVMDSDAKVAVEYATILAYRAKDNKMISGTITDAAGNFIIKSLPFGKYYLIIKFIGYDKQRMDNIFIKPDKPRVNIGEIYLKLASEELNEVNVVADRTQIQYKLDKKVINVGQDVTAAGGSAVDVLEKSPSIQTDIDGNVSLRGSTSFTVFIDGKPSALTGSDALQQIPASEIQSIEIITNPSAKYDPDGVAGIINVVMKKNRLSGLSGVVNLSAGVNDKYKGDFLLNYHTKKINWFVGANYRDYHFLGSLKTSRETYLGDTINFLTAGGDRDMLRKGYSVKTGFDWNISKAQSLNLSLEYGGFEFGRTANSQYDSYSSYSPTHSYYNAIDDFSVKGPYYTATMSYQYNFKKKGHNIQAQITYSDKNRTLKTDFNQYDTDNSWNRLDMNPTTYTNGTDVVHRDLRTKIDYSLPLGANRKLEVGYQSRIGRATFDYIYEDYDYITGTWINNANYSNQATFDRDIHSLYATYADKIAGFGIQVGIRGEYTYRDFYQITDKKDFKIDRFDYFPSAHINRDLGAGFQVQLGYSRRINRPSDRHLNPFHAHADQFSIRTGNPDLGPEYTDSYELNFIKKIGFSTLSLESYYRYGTDKMTRIQILQSDGRLLMTFDNLNTDKSLGAELAANMFLSKHIMFMLSANFYNYQLTGVLDGQEEVASSNNLDARLNATFKFGAATRLQINGFYRGPSASIQGRREAFFFTNAAIKQSFLKNKLSTTLSIRDPFATMHFKFTSQSDYFYSLVNFNRESQVVELSLSYRINNYKSKRSKRGGGDMNNIDDEM